MKDEQHGLRLDGCKKVDTLDLVIITVQLSHTSNIMVNKPTHA